MTTSLTPLDHTLHAIADPTRRRILHALKPRGLASTSAPATGKAGLCAGDIEERVHLSQLLDDDVAGNPIRVAGHCFGCTAGQGSSCGGALKEAAE